MQLLERDHFNDQMAAHSWLKQRGDVAAAGLAVALFLGRAIRGLLFRVQPTDVLTIAGLTVLLLVVGALACLIPARRAVGTDAIASPRFE